MTSGDRHEEPPREPAAGDERPSPTEDEPPGLAGRKPSTGPEAYFTDSATEAIDRSVPEHLIRAKYGTGMVRTSGATAIGDGAIAAGQIVLSREPDGSVRATTWKIDVERLADEQDTYADTEADAELDERLRGKAAHLVYLSGGTGTGRRTTALHALARRHTAARVGVIDLAGQVPLQVAAAQEDLMLPEHGYMLRLVTDKPPDTMTLARLSDSAKRKNASVVLIGAPVPGGGSISRYVINHQPPNPSEVLQWHLCHQLRDGSACPLRCRRDPDRSRPACGDDYVAECLEHSDVAQALCEVWRPADVLEIVQLLAVRPRRDLIGAALAGRYASVRGLVERALRAEAKDGPYQSSSRVARHRRAFRIAYAVLDGRPMTDVFEATGWLMDLLDRETGQTPMGRAVLENDVQSLLGDELRGGPADSVSVPRSARIAKLPNPTLVDAVLDVLWHDYDTSHRPLLRWLDKLARDGRREVRLTAAVTAGRLIAYDLDRLFEELIEDWAGHPEPHLRQTAALACEFAAYDSKLCERIAWRIRRWASATDLSRQDTLLRVHASRFGSTFPAYALQDLNLNPWIELAR